MIVDEIARVAYALAVFVVSVLLAVAILSILASSGPFWPSPLDEIAAVVSFLLKLLLMTLLFFAVPGAFIVALMGFEARTPFFAAGAVGGCLLIFVTYFDYRLSQAHLTSAYKAVSAIVLALTVGLPVLIGECAAAVSWFTLIGAILFCGAMAAFGWRNIFRQWMLARQAGGPRWFLF